MLLNEVEFTTQKNYFFIISLMIEFAYIIPPIRLPIAWLKYANMRNSRVEICAGKLSYKWRQILKDFL